MNKKTATRTYYCAATSPEHAMAIPGCWEDDISKAKSQARFNERNFKRKDPYVVYEIEVTAKERAK